jgi:hypothetical protein
MSTITTPQDLLTRLAEVIGSADPLVALRQKGFTISKGLQDRLDAAKPARSLSPSERQRLAQMAARAGQVSFRVVDRLAPRAPALPEGEWDFVSALRIDVLNEVLVALRTGFEFPREVTEGVALVFTRQRLEALSDDIPSASARIGPLRLTGPLRLSAVGGTNRVVVSAPISLVFLRSIPLPPPLGGPDTVVSSLRGVMTFGVGVEPRVEGDGLELHLSDVIQNPTAAEKVHIAVDADSPIQPRSAEALATFEEEIDLLFRLGVAGAVFDKAGTVCPIIHLPIGGDDDAKLRITDIDVRTHDLPDGDVIMVGVRVSTDELPETGPGDAQTLRNPFKANTGDLNAYVRIHEELPRKLIKQALMSGALQAAASEVRDDLRIDGADAELKNNEFRVILDIRLVDACVPEIDLNVRYTKIYRFSVFEGKFFVTEETDYDLADGDVVVCAVTAGLELILMASAGSLFGLVVDLLRQIPHFRGLLPHSAGAQDNPFQVIGGVFDPKVPVPGTEVLPRIEAVQALLSNDKVESLGTASLRPDDLNTYVYAAFKRRSQDPIPRPPTPIAGARVEIIDQDFPIAPGDDAKPPPEPQVETKTAGKFETTTIVTVTPPRRNQVLASGTTDGQGRVKFVLTGSQLRTTAGTVVTVVRKENLQTGDIQTVRFEKPFLEALPDVFFRVTPQDGPMFDTRLLEGGFLIDLQARRTGSSDAPLTFVVGKGPVSA